MSAKLTIDKMQLIAAKRGGTCLSKKYTNASEQLKWRCSRGHVWMSSPDSVKNQNTWCPKCAGNVRGSIEEVKRVAEARGGKCLSDYYINRNSLLRWKCKEGHVWKASASNVLRGTWCKKCAGLGKLSISHMKKVAINRGGRCLSEKYRNNRTKLRWQCIDGHTWEAAPGKILLGEWCPHCASGIGERACRYVLEHIFRTEFPKTRPKWLLNSLGEKMELDGYSEAMKLAFEYQGEQHYKPSRLYTNFSLERRKQDDENKKTTCENLGITLIQIPHTVALPKLPDYIVEECLRQDINVPKFSRIRTDNMYVGGRGYLERLREYAVSKKGKCLAVAYINSATKVPFVCSLGHKWTLSPNNALSKGRWCPVCGRKKAWETRKKNLASVVS